MQPLLPAPGLEAPAPSRSQGMRKGELSPHSMGWSEGQIRKVWGNWGTAGEEAGLWERPHIWAGAPPSLARSSKCCICGWRGKADSLRGQCGPPRAWVRRTGEPGILWPHAGASRWARSWGPKDHRDLEIRGNGWSPRASVMGAGEWSQGSDQSARPVSKDRGEACAAKACTPWLPGTQALGSGEGRGRTARPGVC